MNYALLPLGVLFTASFASAGAVNRADTSNQLILRMESRMQVAAAGRNAQVQQALQAAKAAGVSLTHWRRMSYDAEVLRLPQELPLEQARALAERIRRQPGVEWVLVDERRFPVAIPDDPEFAARYTAQEVGQQIVDDFGLVSHLWYLESVNGSGTDFKTLALNTNWLSAWNRTTGFSDRSYGGTVAVIDTGIRPHSDLDPARVLPGYDFIADLKTANDGNGRDNDPSDPGDWVDAGSATAACPQENSSWHGTFVAGIVGASANNAKGIAGVNPQAKILPLRALGRCGGFDSDIVDAARWAGGLNVAGVPANANPAHVINFSLGSRGECSSLYQTAFNELAAKGVVITGAAGNSRENATRFTPGNCSHIISVASNSRAGSLADYSNFGDNVSLSAPGGGTTFQIISTSNSGKTTPSTESLSRARGTSFSAPLVAGAAAMVKAIKPSYSASQVKNILELGATPFPQETDCTVRICGAGVLNVDNSLLLAQQGLTSSATILKFSKGDSNPPTQSVSLSNSGTAELTLGAPLLTSHQNAAADFSLSSNCGSTLAAGASCSLTLGFNPDSSATGGRYAWVEVPVQGATARIALYGLRLGSMLSATPAGGLQFEGTTGVRTATQTATFTNTGTQSLSFASASIQQSSAFTIVQTRCDGVTVDAASDCMLPAGAKLELGVAFRASAAGTYQGSVQVQPNEATAASVSLTGSASGSAVSEGGGGGGGGCSVRSGQTDAGLIVLAIGAWAWRRRRLHA